MPASEHIAERILVAVRSNGSEQRIKLAIGRPYRASNVDWACPVVLEGLYPRLVDQHGVDSWQALQLAYQLLEKLLASFAADGGTLLWPEDREPIQLTELFPRRSP